MQEDLNTGFKAHADAFSIGALILARLRRTAGRVIDVMYLVENKIYAQYVIDTALAIEDAELSRLALRLQNLLDLEYSSQPLESVRSMQAVENQDSGYVSGATDEEVYNAQVSHHYIGALR